MIWIRPAALGPGSKRGVGPTLPWSGHPLPPMTVVLTQHSREASAPDPTIDRQLLAQTR
jgi:hypothetical protein